MLQIVRSIFLCFLLFVTILANQLSPVIKTTYKKKKENIFLSILFLSQKNKTHKISHKIPEIPDKITYILQTNFSNPKMHISRGNSSPLSYQIKHDIYSSKHKNILLILPISPRPVVSILLITPWHVLIIPLTRHNYPGNIHLGRNTPVQGGTGVDKACRTLFSLIQIILRIKGDSIHMGKHPGSTLDGPHDLWSIFPSIYAQRGNNHTHDLFKYILVSC